MGAKVFVPLTDEVLYEHPELIAGPLRPYRPEWRELRRLRPEETGSPGSMRGRCAEPDAGRGPGRDPGDGPAGPRVVTPVAAAAGRRLPGAGR